MKSSKLENALIRLKQGVFKAKFTNASDTKVKYINAEVLLDEISRKLVLI